MKLIKQGAYISNVRHYDETHGIADACLMATDFEGSVSVVFDKSTMEITDAKWAIHRAADPERRGQGTAAMLIGQSAYANDRNNIKWLPDYSKCTDYTLPPGGWDWERSEHKSHLEPEITDSDYAKEHKDDASPEWKNIRELYLEILRGVLQAEYYMLPERGYESMMAYELHFGDSMQGNCRPYNGEMPPVQAWPLYTGTPEHYRLYDYYNKYKQFTLIDNEDGTITGTGAYNESFHELTVVLTYKADTGEIIDYDQLAVRVPFEPCKELTHLHNQQFIGKNIRDFQKRDIGKISGGNMGCYHLVDLVAAIADMARE